MNKVQIIADVGSNFDGSLDLACDYIKAAGKCGADVIKFQTLRKDKLIAPRITQDGRWIDNPVYLKFGNLELPDKWHFVLKQTAEQYGIEFMSTPLYLEAVELLEKVGVRRYKIASGDITFEPLLKAVAATSKPVLLSTGASTLDDVAKAVEILKQSRTPDITLLHCVSNYPPSWDEMNIKAVATLKETFNLPVGISDHTPGSLVPIAVVALGATVVEKHITFDRTLPGPDHSYATEIDEFKKLVCELRALEKALGTGKKNPTETELAKQKRIRRGIYDPKTLRPANKLQGIWLRPQY